MKIGKHGTLLKIIIPKIWLSILVIIKLCLMDPQYPKFVYKQEKLELIKGTLAINETNCLLYYKMEYLFQAHKLKF